MCLWKLEARSYVDLTDGGDQVVEQVPDHGDSEGRHRLPLAVERRHRHCDASRQAGVLEYELFV
jgi:hypothetical protein